MQTAKLMIVGGLLGWWMASSALARDVVPQYANPVQQTAFEYDYLNAPQEGASTAPSDRPAAPGDVDSPAGGGDVPASEETSLAMQPGAPQPWKMPQPNFLKQHDIVMGGWLEQGITFSGWPGDQFNGPVGTNDWNGEYQLNQFWMFLDRPANNQGEGWALGGHVDLVYGTDWRFGINHGLEDRFNDFNRQSYGFILPQAYVEVAYDNLSVKLGHFAGILGYEVVPAVANPFYSHSYAMAFGEPLLVTGVMGEYKLGDQWSILAGFDRGWMMFEDYNGALDFMGGVKWVSCDKRTSITYALSDGPQDPDGVQDRLVYSLVLQHQLTERLKYVFQNDMGWQNNTVAAGHTARWSDINQYLLRKINDKWSANLRAEWFRDNDGVRVGGPPEAAGVRAWPLSGFAGDFYEITVGLSWRPKPNVVFRPELRYDWYDGANNAGGQLPFNNGGNSYQILAAGDLIITF